VDFSLPDAFANKEHRGDQFGARSQESLHTGLVEHVK
jgi:hypothetical protein